MIFQSKLEVRGTSIRTNEKGEYHYINLEDDNGDSTKFQIDLGIELKEYKKGDKVLASIDYNTKYGSLKVVDIKKL